MFLHLQARCYLRMSEQCRKKLEAQPPEAQRIVNVLDESIHKMKLLLLLPEELESPDQAALILGDHTAALLSEHLRLSGEQDAQDVQSSLRDFLRAVRPHGAGPVSQEDLGSGPVSQEDLGSGPVSQEDLGSGPVSQEDLGSGPVSQEDLGSGPVSQDDRRPMQELTEGLKNFRDVLLERLVTTPGEEQRLKRRAQEATVRHRSYLELTDKLEKEVAEAEQERDEELRRRDEEILRRSDTLQGVIKETQEYLVKTQSDSLQQKISDQRNWEEKRQNLQLRADQLQTQLGTLTTQHWESGSTLRTKNKKLETQMENLIKRYDSDLGEKQAELEKLMRMYEDERAELKDLQELHAVLEPEYAQIMEERRLAQERRIQEEKEHRARSHAAIIIQAMWRGWSVRKALKNKSKSKSKKSKGGKKGK